MQWLASICVRRPVFATVITLSLTVVGAFAFTKLGLDRFPKVDFPTVVVITRLPGAAPEEVETEVTDKIEEAVNTISGIDELRSNSSEGVSQVIIAFLLEKDGWRFRRRRQSAISPSTPTRRSDASSRA